MADNEKIIAVGFEAKPGNAPQQAAAAGKQVGDEFTRAAEEAIKKLNISGALEGKLAKDSSSSKSFLDNLSKGITGAISEGVKNVPAIMPQVGQFAPPVSKETTSDIERATLGINSFLTGIQAFATYFDKNASMLAVGQLGAQAFEYGQRYLKAQAGAATAARMAQAESAAARASSTDIVAEMSGAGGFRAAAEIGGGGPPPPGGFGGGAAAVAGGGALARLGAIAAEAAAVVGVGAAAITAVTKARDAIVDTAVEGAEKFRHGKQLREVMGVTPGEMEQLKFSFLQVGVPISELESTFFRLAVRARRAMPEIAREVEDSADRQIEANIKVEESGRALADAHDNIALSVDRAKKASGELIKVQQTEREAMEQQRRAADLAISGAQLGERGAQMRAIQAAINLRAAPEQARIADIQGPLTVEGARLGRAGAQINYEEALARFRAQRYGEQEDPDAREMREMRKQDLALAQARHQRDAAEIQERQAELNERKRLAERAAGVGPEAQAQLQYDQAAQAKETAELHTQQVELSKKRLIIEQDNYDYAAREREARAAQDKTIRGISAAIADEEKARIANSDAIKAENRERFKQIPVLQAAIRGEVEPGFPISQINQEQLRKAIIQEGGGTVKGIIEALRTYRESPLITKLPKDEQTQQVLTTAQQLLGGRGLGDQASKLAELVMERREVPPEMQKIFKEREEERVLHPERAERTEGQVRAVEDAQAIREFSKALQEAKTRLEAIAIAPPMIKQRTQDEVFMLGLATKAVQTYGGAESFLKKADEAATAAMQYLGDGIRKGASDVGSAINDLVAAIRGGAGQVKSATGAEKSPSTEAVEFVGADYGQAEGGLLHGLGSGTSDQIPIMASPGEYVVNAESVSKPGVLGLLERINNGYQEGGPVTGLDMALHDSEREWARAASTGPMKTLLDTELHRSEQEWRQAVKTSPMVTGLDIALRQAEAGWAAAVRTTGMRTGLDDALQQAEETWRKSVKSHFQSGGAVARGSAPDATITRNPFVPSSDVSYQERVLIEHDGFDPDNPDDVKLWRERVGRKLPPNMGMPGGSTGSGVIARGQVARGPAPPILIVKPGAGTDYTIPTPAGGAQVRYNPFTGKDWAIGEDKPYNEKDETTFGKPGTRFDPMFSATWSEGYTKDFESNPYYTDIKTSDKDLATPISFGRRRRDEDEDKATGGLIRRYFRSGGRVGMQAGGFPPAPDMGGWITKAALSDLSDRLGHIPSSGAALTPSASALSGLNTLGVHQLDLRTNAGNFPAAVSEETMEAIRNSSLMSKISAAGSRPSWYS